jgi:hypothetical protein
LSYYLRVLRFQSVIIIISYFSCSFVNYIDWFIINGSEPDEFGAKGIDILGSISASLILSILGIFGCSITLGIILTFRNAISNLVIGIIISFWSVFFFLLLIFLFWEKSFGERLFFPALTSGLTTILVITFVYGLKYYFLMDLWPESRKN